MRRVALVTEGTRGLTGPSLGDWPGRPGRGPRGPAGRRLALAVASREPMDTPRAEVTAPVMLAVTVPTGIAANMVPDLIRECLRRRGIHDRVERAFITFEHHVIDGNFTTRMTARREISLVP
jgi:hypothetical protein